MVVFPVERRMLNRSTQQSCISKRLRLLMDSNAGRYYEDSSEIALVSPSTATNSMPLDSVKRRAF